MEEPWAVTFTSECWGCHHGICIKERHWAPLNYSKKLQYIGGERSQASKPSGIPIFLVVYQSIDGHHNKFVSLHCADCCLTCWLALRFMILLWCHQFIFLLKLSCGWNPDSCLTLELSFQSLIPNSYAWLSLFATTHISKSPSCLWIRLAGSTIENSVYNSTCTLLV